MSATATILDVYCVHAATGTDSTTNEAIAALAGTIPVGGNTLHDIANSIPAAVAAIDASRDDPDDLYITTSTQGDVSQAIWPGNGSAGSVGSGQTQPLGVTVPVEGVQNLSLWDHDLSGDDLLGSIRIEESELGQGPIAKMASSPVEGSVYLVNYRVD
ncbi:MULTISPECIES: hypothetical protein [unclassified Streptomyces]|uniref:hypothetical protein n=1 Tax=unclassified Streptomyces TaxID=2593676 RepID=UPI003329DE19